MLMNWKRPCTLRQIPALLDEIPLTERQWDAYLRTVHKRVTEALTAAQAILDAQ